ncbi:nuclear transport factor 2 family protein [Actinomadura rupiterrae]|uniref:nuclear transport factor 2 family protein n=1 Tax=Actinomadura rupiterrae TaxID=559627 RepID=UPI0020A245E4|nr:nuclear transport factor 2 family protein [Actinomadura rupiterrae]MCP2337809.1 hypothetical protein [Actinomadura rupiterrae]
MDIDFEKNQLVARYVAVWNEPDPARRREAIASLWAEDAVELVEEATFTGLTELEARIAEAHQQFVQTGGYTVDHANDAVSHHDAVTFTIRLTQDTQTAWAARVVLLVGEDDLIRHDYQFTTHPFTP